MSRHEPRGEAVSVDEPRDGRVTLGTGVEGDHESVPLVVEFPCESREVGPDARIMDDYRVALRVLGVGEEG